MLHTCMYNFCFKQSYCKYKKKLLLRWGGGQGKREGEMSGGRGRWVAGGGDEWREGEMSGGRGRWVAGGDEWRGEMRGWRRGWEEGEEGAGGERGEKKGREMKRGQFCARVVRASPRREEGGKGREGEVRGGRGRCLPPVHPSKMYTSFKIGFVWAICAYRVLNPHKTVCWHYICFNYSFEAGSGNQAYRSRVGPILSVVSVVVSGIGRGWSCRAGIGQPKGGGRSGRAGFERGCIRDTARIQRLLIGDIYPFQSERVIFYPIIHDQAIKIGRHLSGVGRLSGVNVAFHQKINQ